MINKDFEDFFRYLNKNKVEYLVVGGYAHIYYTEPRYTKDLDILVNPTIENSKRVYKSLCDFFGVKKLKISQLHFTKKNKPGEFSVAIGNPPNSIEIFTNLPGIDFLKAWKNKQRFKYGKVFVWVIGINELEKNFKTVAKINKKLE
ncbi:MAG: hypothetical protein DRI36_04855, partial [Caldiserica bacterium]